MPVHAHAIRRSDPAPSPSAWSAAMHAFLESLQLHGYSALTLRDYQADVQQLREVSGEEPDHLAPPHLLAATSELCRRGLGLAVIRRKRAAWAAFMSFLTARSQPSNVGVGIWARAAAEPAADRVLLGLLLTAGARLHEIAAIEGRDVRIRAGVLVLRVGMRMVPLHPALRLVLETSEAAVPLISYRPLLPGMNGFPLNVRTVHARVRRVLDRLGARGLRPDDLRRDTAAELLRGGAPKGLVTAFLARDRGRPIAPRRGILVDLTCLATRLAAIPFDAPMPDVIPRTETAAVSR